MVRFLNRPAFRLDTNLKGTHMIGIILTLVVTLLTLRLVTPWFTSGRVAFVAERKNALAMQVVAVLLFSALMVPFAIALVFGATFLAALGTGIAAAAGSPGVALSLSIGLIVIVTALEIVATALALMITGKIMSGTVKVAGFGSAILAAIALSVTTSIVQFAANLVVANI